MVFHCLSVEPMQRFDLLKFLAQRLVLAADFHLLQLAQIAQPHVENGVGLHVGELELLHQDGLRLVLAPDDLDHLVEVEIGDEIAAEHLQAMLDLRQPEFGAAHQHVAAMVEPFAQGFGEAEHPRDAALHQHVHVERDAAFELGELEQQLHQNSASTVRARGSITSRRSSANSSRTSATSGSFFSLIRSASLSTSRDFCTSQGICVMTMV